MLWTERRNRFRAVLEGSECVHPASIFDPISARIAEDLGFEIGMFAGSVASHVVLGAPDAFVTTLTEVAEQCRRISRAGTLPFLVDADHGFGNALNVQRTVQELDVAGVAALTIEDTDLPKPFGGWAGSGLIDIAEGVGKMRAALSGRGDPSLVVAARTKMTSAGIEDLVRRVQAYEQTGVDALFVVGLRTREHLEALSSGTRLPLVLDQPPAGVGDNAFLASQRVRITLQGHAPFKAAVQAVYATLQALRQGAAPKDLPNVASEDLMALLTRQQQYARLEQSTMR